MEKKVYTERQMEIAIQKAAEGAALAAARVTAQEMTTKFAAAFGFDIQNTAAVEKVHDDFAFMRELRTNSSMEDFRFTKSLREGSVNARSKIFVAILLLLTAGFMDILYQGFQVAVAKFGVK